MASAGDAFRALKGSVKEQAGAPTADVRDPDGSVKTVGETEQSSGRPHVPALPGQEGTDGGFLTGEGLAAVFCWNVPSSAGGGRRKSQNHKGKGKDG